MGRLVTAAPLASGDARDHDPVVAVGAARLVDIANPHLGRRRIAEISVLHRAPDGLVGVVPALTFTAAGEAITAPGAEALAARLGGRWEPSCADAGRIDP